MCNFPMTPHVGSITSLWPLLCPSVGRSVERLGCWSVCNHFQKGRKLALPCTYRSEHLHPNFLFNSISICTFQQERVRPKNLNMRTMPPMWLINWRNEARVIMNLKINLYFYFSAQQQYEQQLGMFTQFCGFELWCWENKNLEYKYAYYI